MGKQRVLIIGSSGHAKVIIDIFEKEDKYQIIGLLDSFRKLGEETLGYRVIVHEDDFADFILQNPDCSIFIAIGDNWIRNRVVDRILSIAPNVEFATAIHPSAQIGKNVQIGKGTAVMAGVIVNSSATIGNFAILNTKASMDHDCRMGDFSSLAPGVTIGGNVTIGDFSAISIGATVKHNVSIGKHSVVGAGAVLLKNCGDNCIMYGVPAKEIRSRQVGEKYL